MRFASGCRAPRAHGEHPFTARGRKLDALERGRGPAVESEAAGLAPPKQTESLPADAGGDPWASHAMGPPRPQAIANALAAQLPRSI
jgi:hypothetical protein